MPVCCDHLLQITGEAEGDNKKHTRISPGGIKMEGTHSMAAAQGYYPTAAHQGMYTHRDYSQAQYHAYGQASCAYSGKPLGYNTGQSMSVVDQYGLPTHADNPGQLGDSVRIPLLWLQLPFKVIKQLNIPLIITFNLITLMVLLWHKLLHTNTFVIIWQRGNHHLLTTRTILCTRADQRGNCPLVQMAIEVLSTGTRTAYIFPWMKTTKSHAHQWKAGWSG